jgi:Domain of unknown function (DUF4388)
VNIWVVLGAVAALVLVVVLIGTRRPRRAEDELAQPIQQAARPNGQSSLGQGGLKALLRSMQTARETGTLQVTAGDRSASLYFLFGHLFHAASGTLTGEPALQECLAWQDFRYTFDKTAKLPTEESIERQMNEILA